MAVAAYTPTVWVSGGAPGIDKSQLDNIENQIDAITDDYNDHVGDADNYHDHGTLLGLTDIADHPGYLILDGSRDLTGVQVGVTPVADADLATKGYVDGADEALQYEQWWSYPTGDIVVETGTHRVYAEEDRTIVKIQAFVSTAPTGTAIEVDVHKDGVTLFTTQTNMPEIAISGFTSTTTAPDITAWAAGTYLTVDIDVIGSTIAGAGLTLKVIYTKDAA